MNPTRPLRQVFGELVDGALAERDVAGLLRDSGYSDLPEALLNEAIVTFADTSTIEVAEHLAPFVATHAGVVPGSAPDPRHGLELLADAPVPLAGEVEHAAPEPNLPAVSHPDNDPVLPEPPHGSGFDELAFGAGSDTRLREVGEPERLLPPSTSEAAHAEVGEQPPAGWVHDEAAAPGTFDDDLGDVPEHSTDLLDG